MRLELRREARQVSRDTYSVCWQDENGITHSVPAQGIDVSRLGIGFRAPVELPSGATVFLQSESGAKGYAVVRHCTRHQSNYIFGVELNHETANPGASSSDGLIDHYEFLQISPKAEFATIQRVYRFLAGRLHPDNPETGNSEKFLLLKHAFEVLSDPQRRAEYDATLHTRESPPNPVFESIDYMDGIEGEVNRRLAVLSLLYSKRRSCPEEPRVSLADVESRMGFPREYLDFATWYLKSKKYITVEDNSDFALTALGVDYVESNAAKIPVLNKLLNSSPWGGNAPAGRRRSPFADDRFRLGAGEAEADGNGADDARHPPLQLT